MNIEKGRPVWMFLEIRTHHVLHNHFAHACKGECMLEGGSCSCREVGRKENLRKTTHCFPVRMGLLDDMHANLLEFGPAVWVPFRSFADATCYVQSVRC